MDPPTQTGIARLLEQLFQRIDHSAHLEKVIGQRQTTGTQ